MPKIDPVQTIADYVRFPSVSTDPAAAAGMAGARGFIAETLRQLGFEVEIIETPRHPIVLAERPGPPQAPHLVLYGHYDVQPADPLELWTVTGAFEPIVKDGRLYGRGAADNKGPTIVHMAALANILEKHPDLPLRITYLIEGEEEIGSPSFRGFLETYANRLKGDFALVSDTGIPNPDQVVITCGLRGLTGLHVELTGPKQDLHSGVHGGNLLNPIEALTSLCASLHDAEGRVNVPGFYDDVLPVAEWEREELAKLSTDPEEYRQWLGVPDFRTPPGFNPLEAVRFQPTLEFNGIGGGFQGSGSKTVIPSKAFVKITCRLVPNQQAEDIRNLVKKTLEERCPPQVTMTAVSLGDGEPYLFVPPGRSNTPSDQNPRLAEACRSAERHIGEVWKNPAIFLREGGSVPIIADLKTYCGLDSLLIGLFTPEDNLHAPNESFHLGVAEKAITAFEGIIGDIAGVR
jgi:acetylornithine deacetylase/succinyl-diaminopimelate desuccinylase-like protein